MNVEPGYGREGTWMTREHILGTAPGARKTKEQTRDRSGNLSKNENDKMPQECGKKIHRKNTS